MPATANTGCVLVIGQIANVYQAAGVLDWNIRQPAKIGARFNGRVTVICHLFHFPAVLVAAPVP